MKRLLMFLLIPMLYASCNTATSVEELAAIQGEWRLQRFQVGGGGAVNVPIPARYTARFEPDGTVNFQVDCNRCSGSYTTDGNAITIGPLLACTACRVSAGVIVQPVSAGSSECPEVRAVRRNARP